MNGHFLQYEIQILKKLLISDILRLSVVKIEYLKLNNDEATIALSIGLIRLYDYDLHQIQLLKAKIESLVLEHLSSFCLNDFEFIVNLH